MLRGDLWEFSLPGEQSEEADLKEEVFVRSSAIQISSLVPVVG